MEAVAEVVHYVAEVTSHHLCMLLQVQQHPGVHREQTPLELLHMHQGRGRVVPLPHTYRQSTVDNTKLLIACTCTPGYSDCVWEKYYH